MDRNKAVDSINLFQILFAIVCVQVLIWFIGYYQLAPLAVWGLSEGDQLRAYVSVVAFIGVGAGLLYPSKGASQSNFLATIVTSGIICAFGPLLYNWYSGSPPTTSNYYLYHFICTCSYVLTYAALGYCSINICRVMALRRNEKQTDSEAASERPGNLPRSSEIYQARVTPETWSTGPAISTGHPRSAEAPADVNYIVFCRLDGIKDVSADLVAASAEVLMDVVARQCAENNQNSPSLQALSSVYGRLVVVPRRVQAALDLSKRLHTECARAGVRLAIGVASGRVEVTQDLSQHNLAGTVINQSARLAHLKDGAGRIAVDARSVHEAISSSNRYPAAAFGPEQRGRVKSSELTYHWLDYPSSAVGPRPTPREEHEAETAHVVVYDIVGFSQKELRDLVQVVEDLNHAVRRAMEFSGGDRLGEGKDRWYAPAGDGGVLVFRADLGGGGRSAWAFTKALLDQTRGRIALRIGVASGPIVVLKGSLPVGSGILKADWLSGVSSEGGVCVSRDFWENVLESVDKSGWHSSAIPTIEDALAVWSVAAAPALTGPESPEPPQRDPIAPAMPG